MDPGLAKRLGQKWNGTEVRVVPAALARQDRMQSMVPLVGPCRVETEASDRIWLNFPPARVWVYRRA